MPKFLIIRFSSIGDIIQCMGVISGIRDHFPDAEIHWIARKDMSTFLAMDQRISKVWAFDKDEGLRGLWQIAHELRKEKYDYIYDAHSNIRSNILKLRLKNLLRQGPHFALRSKERWKRFLLFNFGINRFEWPFQGVKSYQKPLEKWGITRFPASPQEWAFPQAFAWKYDRYIDKQTITLVPSANWEMKRWPIGYWKKLITMLPEYRFIIVAGPADTFCEEIRSVSPSRVHNFAGEANLFESCYLIHQSNLVVSGDTGFMHAADLFRIPTLALMGPTAFGFPYGPTAEVLEIGLSCRPCSKDGRGKCKQCVYQKCLVDITPEKVAERIKLRLPLYQP